MVVGRGRTAAGAFRQLALPWLSLLPVTVFQPCKRCILWASRSSISCVNTMHTGGLVLDDSHVKKKEGLPRLWHGCQKSIYMVWFY